ncbi:hypothetical protein DSO57_1010519 [Entomophthora muscae]|uniref:Uncharacterized protein n=1 Tax=Entomophthora muscae TaxID=34485 RepID=A0ACC2U4T3_9FUNG|nr:hypothetical protein DSO57_1010519 [Entomophthora muscae]
MPVNIGAVPDLLEAETRVLSQCPEFYAEDTLILSQAIYLGLFWLGLIILLNPKISQNDLVGDSPPHGDCFLLSCDFSHIHGLNGQDRLGWCRLGCVLFTQHTCFEKIQDVLAHTQPPNITFHDFKEVKPSGMSQGVVVVQYSVASLCGGNIGRLFPCLCAAADIAHISGELTFIALQLVDGY